MPTKRLTGDLAQTSVGINPGIAIPGGADQVIGLTDWTMTIKTKSIDGSTTDDDAWEDWLPSMSSWTAKAKFVYLMGEPSQMTNIIQATIGTGRRTSSQWNFFLDSESGDDSFSGQAFISGLGISSIIGRTVTMDVTLQGRGPLNLRNQASFLASLVLPSGAFTKTFSVPLGSRNWGAIWSGFTLVDSLPGDAVITAIYPTIIASAVHDFCLQYLMYGSVADGGLGGGLSGAQFTVPFATGFVSPEASFASTQFTAASIGTSLSDLIGQKIGVAINSSLLTSGLEEMFVTGLAFAILYTSATPVINALMPPPVTVPSGQGMALALPFGAVDLLGPPSGDGTAVATPALSEE
jgi:hypothetical protein